MKSNKLIIILISLVAFVYQIVHDFEYLKVLFIIDLSEFEIRDIIRSVLPLIILPIGLLYFWKRKTIGWILLSSGHLYLLMVSIGLLITHIWQESLWDLVAICFPVNLTDYLPQFILNIVILFLLFINNIPLNYNIKKRWIFWTVTASLIVSAYTEYYISDLIN